MELLRANDMDMSEYWTYRNALGTNIADALHGKVQLGPLARQFCDTAPVQRLRWLHQLGCCSFVYPTAEHMRFAHSVGTAHLTVEAVKHLASTGQRINPLWVELLEVAGLCHDLGHGPFSHMFESALLPALGVQGWNHENNSARLLEHIVDTYSIDIAPEELHFVQDVISNGSGIPAHRAWSGMGWMLQIVANHKNGIDTDKIDYLKRDARMSGVGQAHDYTMLLHNCKVVDDEVCYSASQQANLAGLFNARAAMHQQVYQHRFVKAVEFMIVDALKAADPVLRISHSIHRCESFLQLDDSLLNEVKRAAWRNPQDPHLKEAAAVLERLDQRDLYVWVAEATLPAEFGLAHSSDDCELPAADVVAQQDSNLGAPFTQEDIRVYTMKIDYCKGKEDPLDYVQLYDSSDSSSSSSSSTWPASMGIIRPAVFIDRKVRVYLARACQGSDRAKLVQAVLSAFTRAVQQRFGRSVYICSNDDGGDLRRAAWLKEFMLQRQQQTPFQAAFSSGNGSGSSSTNIAAGTGSSRRGCIAMLPFSGYRGGGGGASVVSLAQAGSAAIQQQQQSSQQQLPFAGVHDVVVGWNPEQQQQQQGLLQQQQHLNGVKRRADGIEYVPASDEEEEEEENGHEGQGQGLGSPGGNTSMDMLSQLMTPDGAASQQLHYAPMAR